MPNPVDLGMPPRISICHFQIQFQVSENLKIKE